MNKKNTVKKTAAFLLGLALTVGATGCNFVVTDTAEDYAQTIATVDISDRLEKDDAYKAYADDVRSILENIPSTIAKSDLISYFMSVGYQYVQSYGYSYKDTFNMLLDGLINREIMVQYAIAYYLKKGADSGINAEACKAYVVSETAKAEGKEKELLEAHPEVLTLKYFLTENGKDMEDYDRTVYNLKSSLNRSLDSMEANYIESENEEHDHGSRTTPTGVDTAKEDYYTNEYDVYTGRNTLDSCKGYKKVDGSTTVTRQKAYNAFLANLQSYNLIKKGEDMKEVTLLDYYYVELASSLGQALITKYFEDLESTALTVLDTDGKYVTDKYNDLYNKQAELYENDTTAFATAMDSVSDTSFLLYGLKDYGFVYNILLPFSTSQELAFNTAKLNAANTETDKYNVRRDILSQVKGKDLRSAWVDEHEHANKAYKGEDGKWYFFEENFTNADKYEALDHYLNLVPFNGKINEETMEVEETNKVSVDDVLNSYLDYAKSLGLTVEESTPVNELGEKYDADKASYNKAKKDKDGNVVYDKDGKVVYTKDVDYSNFVYRAGKVNVTSKPSDYFKADTDLYKLLSYANELMFAYSTDEGCLNKYMGYSVSPYTTNYMKEFEYAAQQAVAGGVGSFAVCPTDYGWHIIITTFSYSIDGDVYGGYNHAEKDVDGTFSNLFYNTVKDSVVNNYTNEVQSGVLKEYNTELCVTKYQSRYQDLLDMEA